MEKFEFGDDAVLDLDLEVDSTVDTGLGYYRGNWRRRDVGSRRRWTVWRRELLKY